MYVLVLSKLKKVISEINSNLENRAYKIATTVGIIVFALGVFSTYIYAGSLSSQRTREMESYQNEQVDYVEKYITNKLDTYEELLIAGAAFHKMNDNVTKSDWRNIYYNLRIPDRASELLGFGYVEYVKGNQLPQYVENTRQSLADDYSVFPTSNTEEHAPIKYIEPLNEVNKLALGYDMYTDSNRYEAMIIAKQSGEPTLSGPIVAVQDKYKPNPIQSQSLVMYYPVYEEDRIEVAEVKTLVGYTYIIFRTDDIMQNISVDGMDSVSNLSIQDTAQERDQFLYTKYFNTTETEVQQKKIYERNINVLSRNWTIGLLVKQQEVSSLLNPTRVFIRGVIFSLMLGSLLFLILLKRASDINKKHSLDLQRTKDELLALASHQLRTPATGVRQYVGMLTQGYFGALNKDQLSIAEKAYQTSERQLEIIDQLLYVAKADAGQLVVSFETIDIAKITREVIDNYSSVAKNKNINMEYKGRKKLLCSGDKRYVTMIIENLLSNAIKYSYPDSKVCIELKKDDESIVLKIKDQGIGIAEEDIPKLFQKFSRFDSPLSRSEGGSGLGLFMAQKLAQSHDGQIVAKSNGVKGSTFILTLPVRNEANKNVIHLTV